MSTDQFYALTLVDLAATAALADCLAKSLTPDLIIYLNGELGAGKTTLVRGILNGLGYTGITKSPTYTLVETYSLQNLLINHFDLYRLADPSELEFIGIREYVSNNSICIFEWPQKGVGIIPPADLNIDLEIEHHKRKVIITANTVKGLNVLQSITASGA